MHMFEYLYHFIVSLIECEVEEKYHKTQQQQQKLLLQLSIKSEYTQQ